MNSIGDRLIRCRGLSNRRVFNWRNIHDDSLYRSANGGKRIDPKEKLILSFIKQAVPLVRDYKVNSAELFGRLTKELLKQAKNLPNVPVLLIDDYRQQRQQDDKNISSLLSPHFLQFSAQSEKQFPSFSNEDQRVRYAKHMFAYGEMLAKRYPEWYAPIQLLQKNKLKVEEVSTLCKSIKTKRKQFDIFNKNLHELERFLRIEQFVWRTVEMKELLERYRHIFPPTLTYECLFNPKINLNFFPIKELEVLLYQIHVDKRIETLKQELQTLETHPLLTQLFVPTTTAVRDLFLHHNDDQDDDDDDSSSCFMNMVSNYTYQNPMIWKYQDRFDSHWMNYFLSKYPLPQGFKEITKEEEGISSEDKLQVALMCAARNTYIDPHIEYVPALVNWSIVNMDDGKLGRGEGGGRRRRQGRQERIDLNTITFKEHT